MSLQQHALPAAPATATRHADLAAVISSIAIVGIATGLTAPLVTVRMTAAGHSAEAIGLMAALPAVGLTLGALASPLLTRLGTVKRLMLLATLGSMLATFALGASASLPVWIAARLLMGCCDGVGVVLGEAWLNHLADERRRGRLVALYATIYTLCQAAGPGLLAGLGADGWAALGLVTALHLVACGFVLATRGDFEHDAEEAGGGLAGLAMLLRATPSIAAGVLLFAVFDGTVLALMPVYGLAHGFGEARSALMISAVFWSDAAMQIPLGWLSDRIGRARVHAGCGAAMTLAAFALPLAAGSGADWLLWPLLCVMGAAAGGTYTLAMVLTGSHYGGGRLVAANAALGLLWGAGNLLGPGAGGVAVGRLGGEGLMLMFGGLAAVFSLAAMRAVKRLGAGARVDGHSAGQ
ncbi:MFS transporter [Derxia lacustris]|uniref:MFS transporter n=1 Tax=Derxia lacustris TaxID=764842 RepID=UPI000A1785E3|nr:MFS transporter [Derxia lacustris]